LLNTRLFSTLCNRRSAIATFRIDAGLIFVK
jgi:hypothetical protein